MLERRDGGELRAEGRRLSGVVMRYGDVSPSHRERFEPAAFRMAEAVPLNLYHDAERAVAWQPGGGLELRQDKDALRMVAELPPIPAANRALAMVREGQATGLSVEFRAVRERRESGLRVVEAALLTGIGIVRAPSYEASRVEARRRSGRTLKARVPANMDVECRCSGVTCRFARITGDAMREAFEEAFDAARREVIAGFGSYDAPLASVSAGTLRGRILDGGDGEVEIDLPDGAAGAATVAAHEAAGVIVRPHIDAAAAVSTEEGETRVYQSAPIRAFLVSATDARQGWPAPALVATPDELASADAPRIRQRRRLWL
ncbi:MAG: HK97 family phage prohead protease [Alphaproteobacteria bacterium]|nr:HK97 family phage prohead protease [Alphaproteobacteria bacterium]